MLADVGLSPDRWLIPTSVPTGECGKVLTHKESMAPVLDDLLNDGRLVRLFSKDTRHCALQLWILQIKSGQSIENRVIFGRLLPYSHSSDCWSASDDDDFEAFRENLAHVVWLNLYVKSDHCV